MPEAPTSTSSSSSSGGVPDFEDYGPPLPRESGSTSSFMSISRIVGLLFLGKRVYDLGGSPWSPATFLANFKAMPGLQKGLMIFMVLRALNMSPI